MRVKLRGSRGDVRLKASHVPVEGVRLRGLGLCSTQQISLTVPSWLTRKLLQACITKSHRNKARLQCNYSDSNNKPLEPLCVYDISTLYHILYITMALLLGVYVCMYVPKTHEPPHTHGSVCTQFCTSPAASACTNASNPDCRLPRGILATLANHRPDEPAASGKAKEEEALDPKPETPKPLNPKPLNPEAPNPGGGGGGGGAGWIH